jgi:hypothetical protein
MLEKIETREIMTTRAATDKYRTKFFDMVITEVVDHGDNDLGYVIYVADKRKELNAVSRDEFKGKKMAFLYGVGTEPYPSIGNVVYHE